MSTPAPFEVTPEALQAVWAALRQHPEMQAGLIRAPNFEVLDEQGKLEARFQKDSFWMAYDSPDHFSQWPRVDLCGQSVPIAQDALESLRGKTLTLEANDSIFEGQKIWVAANKRPAVRPVEGGR